MSFDIVNTDEIDYVTIISDCLSMAQFQSSFF